MSSVQDAEVLTLKVKYHLCLFHIVELVYFYLIILVSSQELVARFVLREDRNRSSLVHRMLPHYPLLTAMLAKGSYCALCLDPILTTWLECVQFISLKKVS